MAVENQFLSLYFHLRLRKSSVLLLKVCFIFKDLRHFTPHFVIHRSENHFALFRNVFALKKNKMSMRAWLWHSCSIVFNYCFFLFATNSWFILPSELWLLFWQFVQSKSIEVLKYINTDHSIVWMRHFILVCSNIPLLDMYIFISNKRILFLQKLTWFIQWFSLQLQFCFGNLYPMHLFQILL